MSYTIVIDKRERMKHAANVTNMLRRNCRIGKVREKTGIKWADDALRGLPAIPAPFRSEGFRTGWPFDGSPMPKATS